MAIASGAITTCDPNAAIVEWFEKLGKYCASGCPSILALQSQGKNRREAHD